MGKLSNTQHSSGWLSPRKFSDSDKPLSMMDRLFNRMDGSYPHKWRSAFANAQAIQNWREAWAEAFDEENLTPDEVRVGIATCRKLYDWPPSLPEFLKACRPSLEYERAYHEAIEQMKLREDGKDNWSSPAIYWAACFIGNDLKNNHYSAISKRWASAVDNARERIKRGELPNKVPERLNTLPAPGRTTINQEQVEERLREVKEKLKKNIVE